MTDAQYDWLKSEPPAPDPTRTRVILALSASLLTVVVMATLVAVVLTSTDDRGGGGTDGDVILAAANITDGDEFARPILVVPIRISSQAGQRSADLLEQVPIRAERAVRVVSGQQSELFGATGEVRPCDVVALANDLDADPDTARLWALSLGLRAAQVPHYLNTLTAVVLMADTWVTEHVRSSSGTHSQQAVLQAGNAVLVDPLGVPRVRCASSSPLTPPANTTLTRLQPVGEQWDGYATHTVVAVQYSQSGDEAAATEFNLIDVETGQPLTRKVGGSIDLGDGQVPLPDPAVMNVAPTSSSGTP